MKFKWLMAALSLLFIWMGIDIALSASFRDAPILLDMVAFGPAFLCAFYFALESDWIK